jgi:archaeal type IV pilus assembly protein PilA
MNVFGQRERSWRKSRKRGVSPIIATILLVAITVVLAAVLYVLISGLTHGPGSTPIGSAFTAGNPISSTTTGGAAAACSTIGAASTIATFVPTAHYLYTLTVETSTISMSSALFEVKTSTGAVDTAALGFYIVNVGGTVVTCANGLTGAMTSTMGFFSSGATACNGAACTTSSPLTSIYTIVIDMGTTNPTGTGLSFVAIGTGSYSGTSAPLSLP